MSMAANSLSLKRRSDAGSFVSLRLTLVNTREASSAKQMRKLVGMALLAIMTAPLKAPAVVLASVLARGHTNQSMENQPEIALITKSYVVPDFGD